MINIYSLINEARKSGKKHRLSAYQNLLAELQKYETSPGAEPLTEAKQLEIFSKYVKTLDDSIFAFKQANRDDLYTQYTVEREIVKELLPEPVSGDKLVNFIIADEYFNKYNTSVYSGKAVAVTNEGVKILGIPKKEMGTCIKYVKSKFPTADGKDIANIIKSMVI